MIKKTFKTIFKNKIILMFLGIVFALSIASKTVHSLMNEQLLNPSSFSSNVFIYIQLTQLYGFFDSLLHGLFITAPILYCVLLINRDNVHKGWYKQGIKRNWWRYLIIWAVFYFVNTVSTYIINMVGLQTMTVAEQASRRMSYMVQGVGILLALIRYFIVAPVIAEGSFANGLRNMFIVGRKYFFRLLGVYLVTTLLLIIVTINPNILFMMPVLSVASSLLAAFISVFMYAYSMNLYLAEKEKLEPTVKHTEQTII